MQPSEARPRLLTRLNLQRNSFSDYLIPRVASVTLFFDSKHESSFHNHPAGTLQHIHDIRLVWPSQASGNEGFHFLAAHTRDSFFLGSRFFRILRPGSGEPYRFLWKRRPLQPCPAQGHPGGRVIGSLHSDCYRSFQGRVPALEPSGRLRLPCAGGFLRLP